jgi:ABC-type multidrug transport system ATPase subunit
MISDGKTVFQGNVAGLRANRGTELVLRPESAVQVPVLAKLVQQAGFGAHTENLSLDVDVVVAEAGTQDAAAINRLAMHADVTLIHIAERTRSLEEAFFELTGSHSRDTTPTHSLGGIK